MARRAPVRQTHATSCATPAPPATVVRGRSPIARPIARLFSFPEAGECEAHVSFLRNRLCGSSTAIYPSTVSAL
jgi:hypothetical protein